MYDLYKEKCNFHNMKILKQSMYRKIFTEEYNLGFFVPKKDQCDICEGMKQNSGASVEGEVNEKYVNHMSDKFLTKQERDLDRKVNDVTKAVVCFDLENVLVLPKANVSNFFYKRKLNVYNLTAHVSTDGEAYNAIWTESLAGRGANEISSALVTILKSVSDKYPEIKSYTLWSDSCVPQNRNSVMTLALKTFMLEYSIDNITQKFGCPGHSSIQEVDNIHSQIERTLRNQEVFSPVSLLRVLKTVRRKKPFIIIQMERRNFMDFQKSSATLKFSDIPYSKAKCLNYTRDLPFRVEYKLSFSETQFADGVIRKPFTRGCNVDITMPVVKPSTKVPSLSKEKQKDIASMLQYMSDVDRQYYLAIGISNE